MIKYSKDDRYDKDGIATHDKTVSSATGTTELKNLTKCASDFGVIGIDEGQFFPDLVEFCEMMADAGKTVIVAALNGTFQRKPFGSVLDLIPLAESVDKLNAVCMICFKDASFTKRITKEQEVTLISMTSC
jgi:thymidine kinase